VSKSNVERQCLSAVELEQEKHEISRTWPLGGHNEE
jgi:hypothetical protein